MFNQLTSDCFSETVTSCDLHSDLREHFSAPNNIPLCLFLSWRLLVFSSQGKETFHPTGSFLCVCPRVLSGMGRNCEVAVLCSHSPTPGTDRLVRTYRLQTQSLSLTLCFPLDWALSFLSWRHLSPKLSLSLFTLRPSTFCDPVSQVLMFGDLRWSQLIAECGARLLSRAELHEGVVNDMWIPRLQLA